MKQTCLLLAAFFICLTAGAQTRYLDEVFSDVTVTSNIQYGTNVTVITLAAGLPPTEQPLVHKDWEKPHQENLTGTVRAYAPQGSIRQAGGPKERSDYEAWVPE